METIERVVHPSSALLTECHAASLVELTDGTLLCAWCAGASERAPDTAIHGAALAPGAAVWTPRSVFLNTPNFSDGNPTLLLDGQGRLWLFFVTLLGHRWDTCQVKYVHSLDGGHTWTASHILRMDWGWITSGKPLLRPDRAILLPLYNEKGTAFVMSSEEKGIDWQSSNLLGADQGVLQPTLAPLSDGKLLMYLRAQKPSSDVLWQSVSVDEGQTWSAPTQTALPDAQARIDLTALASGRLVLAFQVTSENPAPLTLALSEDEGQTWPYRFEVAADPGEASNPTLIQARDGRLHLVYTRQRSHLVHLVYDEEFLLAKAQRV